MEERNNELAKLIVLVLFVALILFGLNSGANAQMDLDARNPGNDKRQCLSYEECPVWDGNPDTKMWYDLMKGSNGTGKVETDFNWNVHLYLCHQNKLLDSINGEGAFERLAISSAQDGMIPCPINVNPHWSYDWESHIFQAQTGLKEANSETG